MALVKSLKLAWCVTAFKGFQSSDSVRNHTPEDFGNDTDRGQGHCPEQDPDQCSYSLRGHSVSVKDKKSKP